MNYGLKKEAVEKICDILANFTEIQTAVLYGSRAKGNYKIGSDIDLTLYGEKLSLHLLNDIADALDELLLPYTINLSIFDKLKHPELCEHIQRIGVVFYEKGNE
jgi:uncharacterized protein